MSVALGETMRILLFSLSALLVATSPSHAEQRSWNDHLPLDELRGLPACEPGQAELGHGEQYTCVPPLSKKDLGLRFGLELAHGIVDGDTALTHNQFQLGVESQIRLGRTFGIGARYGLGVLGLPGERPDNPDGIHARLRHTFAGSLHWRHFTDEIERNALAFSAGIGYSLNSGSSGLSDGTHLRFSLARETGSYVSDRTALSASLIVAYEQSLTDDQLSSLTLGVQGNVELGIAKPRNLHEPEAPPSRFSLAYGVNFIPWMGFGVDLRTQLVPDRLDLVASADTIIASVGNILENDYYSLHGGMRLRVADTAVGELYLRSQGGPSIMTRDEDDLRYAWTGNAEIGLAWASCGVGVELGSKVLLSFDAAGTDFEAAGLAIRVLGKETRDGSCGPSAPTRPHPYVAPPPVPRTPPPRRERTPSVEPPVEGAVEVEVDAQVEVEVIVEPIIIEVVIGASFLGGAIDIRVDPRLLPLAQLRSAARVDIEILAPRSQAARVQGEVHALLSREGIRIDSSVIAESSGTAIKARFTIMPR